MANKRAYSITIMESSLCNQALVLARYFFLQAMSQACEESSPRKRGPTPVRLYTSYVDRGGIRDTSRPNSLTKEKNKVNGGDR